MENLLVKLTFFASKLKNGRLLEYGPLIEILQYIWFQKILFHNTY